MRHHEGMAKDKTLIIMGAPYVFARKKLKKPFHTEVVKLVQRPALCHNSCGLYYIPTEEQLLKGGQKMRNDVRCPECNEPPKPFKVGAEEEIEIAVKMAFGNLIGVDFLRALGPVSSVTKVSTHEIPFSFGHVTPPKQD